MSHYDNAVHFISQGEAQEAIAEGILALVEAQTEATAWAKEQIVIMRRQQEEFLADLRRELAER